MAETQLKGESVAGFDILTCLVGVRPGAIMGQKTTQGHIGRSDERK